MRQAENSAITLEGYCEPPFAPVHELFVTNFEQGQEVQSGSPYKRGARNATRSMVTAMEKAE